MEKDKRRLTRKIISTFFFCPGEQLGQCDEGIMLGALVGNALGVDVIDALGALVGDVLARTSGLQKESRTATQTALLPETRTASSWDTAT